MENNYDYIEKIIRDNVEKIVQEEMNKAAQDFMTHLYNNKDRYVEAAMKAINISRNVDGEGFNYRIIVEHVMKKDESDEKLY